jgi:TPR repeat protein
MKRIGLLLVALTLCEQAWAGPVEDGVTAYESRDYATALGLFRPLADQGNAAAQYYLGMMYDLGNRSQSPVPQDYAQALKWYHLAADQGFALAQAELGFLYQIGLGLTKDFAEAVKWYRLAADQGDADAQFELGDMYSQGQGVPQDYVQAHMWYNLAASRFPDKPENDLAAQNRDLVAAKMTPAQIAEAQKLAREWRPK